MSEETPQAPEAPEAPEIPEAPEEFQTPREPQDMQGLSPAHFSLKAEEAVVGSLLIHGESWDDVAAQLSQQDFYNSDCAMIYGAISALAERTEAIDLITVEEQLKKANTLDPDRSSRLFARLLRLADMPTAEHVNYYAKIVREHAVRRRLISAAHQIMKGVAEDKDMTSAELLDRAEQIVFELGDKVAGVTDIKKMSTLGAEVVKQTQALSESGDGITGLATGYKQFDERTGGMQAGDLLILAARPSMGKTALALCIAEYVALKSDKGPVVIFSMEMSMEQIAKRLCSSIGRIDQLRLRTGKLEDSDWTNLTQAVHLLTHSDNEILVDDTPALRPENVRAKVRRLKRQHKRLGLVIIDYLQLMRPPSGRVAENRNLELTEISQSLKALARETGVPILALSQLNRNLEQRTNKRPQMSDLRDSGSLEQDADVLIFIYRDEVYNDNSPDKGTAEIIVSKQRNGPQFATRLSFIGAYTRFENHVEESHVPVHEDAGGHPEAFNNDKPF